MASTARERILPRSATATRLHSDCALRAAAIADSISAADEDVRRTTSRPSTGEMQTMSGMFFRSFRGASEAREPGIHKHRPCDDGKFCGYGFRPSLRSAGMTPENHQYLS